MVCTLLRFHINIIGALISTLGSSRGNLLPHVLNTDEMSGCGLPRVFRWINRTTSLPDKRCQSLFTCHSRCCFSFLSITWFEEHLSTPALSQSSIIAHSSPTRAPTSPTAVQYGILFGAVLAPFSYVLGSRSILIYRPQGSARRRPVFRNGSGIHFYHLPNIAFHRSYVRYSYPSIF